MIRAPSLVSEYSLCFSGDPALNLPADETERDHALNHAKLTGDWSKLIGDKEQPTLFQFKQITRSQLGWLMGEASHSHSLGRPLAPIEVDDLTVRLALVKIDNFGAHQAKHQRVNGQWLATQEIIDTIHAEAGDAGAVIIGEFAQHIIERATGRIRPL